MKKLTLIPALLALALTASPALAADGGAIFQAKCAMCHGAKGMGDGPAGKALHARNLVSGKYEKGSSVASIAKTVSNGFESMPAFKGQLKADELQAVAKYVVSLQKKAPKAKAKAKATKK